MKNQKLASHIVDSKLIGKNKESKRWIPENHQFEDNSTSIYRNFYSKEVLSKYELNKRQSEALQLWKNEGEITTGIYKDYFKITDRTALRDLLQLVDMKLLIKTGDKKSAKYLFKK